MDDREERIRRKAYELWEADGCPEGRHDDHWVQAREIVALEEAGGPPTISLDRSRGPQAEPAVAQENLGDRPGLRDQGDDPAGPELERMAESSDQRPLSVEDKPKRGRARVTVNGDGQKGVAPKSAANGKGPGQPDGGNARGRKRPSSGAGANR